MIALDSSVIVAALRSIDDRHDQAMRSLQRALEDPEKIVVPVHSVVETYAVITRIPPPHRMAPADAESLLRKTFASIKLAPLSSRSLWPLLGALAGAELGGGITYDAIILRSAEDAGATVLLTLNPEDYERLSPRLEIRTP